MAAVSGVTLSLLRKAYLPFTTAHISRPSEASRTKSARGGLLALILYFRAALPHLASPRAAWLVCTCLSILLTDQLPGAKTA